MPNEPRFVLRRRHALVGVASIALIAVLWPSAPAAPAVDDAPSTAGDHTASTRSRRQRRPRLPRNVVARLAAEDRETHEGPPQIIRLRWPEMPAADGDVAELARPELVLAVDNLSSDDADVDIRVTIDAGDGDARRHAVAAPSVAAGTTTRIPIDVPALGVDLDALRFSARLHATARATTNTRTDETTSPELYFHRARAGDAGLLVYDEIALRERFGAGDFAGRLRVPDEPGVITERVVAVTVTTSPPPTSDNPTDEDTGDDQP